MRFTRYSIPSLQGRGSLGLNVGGPGGPRSCYSCFTCTSRTWLQSRLYSQTLTIPTPSVFFRLGWSITMVPLWVTVSRFLGGEWGGWIKTHYFLFTPTLVFSCLSSSPDPQRYSSFECCLLGVSLIIIMIIIIIIYLFYFGLTSICDPWYHIIEGTMCNL